MQVIETTLTTVLVVVLVVEEVIQVQMELVVQETLLQLVHLKVNLVELLIIQQQVVVAVLLLLDNLDLVVKLAVREQRLQLMELRLLELVVEEV